MRVTTRIVVFLTSLALQYASTVHGKIAFVPRGAEGWKFLDTGEAPPAGWKDATFDDSTWKSGKAPLGYEDEDIATILSFGEDKDQKHPATFFRRSIDVPAGTKFLELRAALRCDDGAALYLNGKQIATFNLTPGPVTEKTLAGRAIDGPLEQQYFDFTLPAEALKEGGNLLAVSVHQSAGDSSDLFFDLEITGIAESDLPPRAILRPEAKEVVETFRTEHFVPPGTAIPEGYLDGGTYMKVKDDGSIVSTREVITVDRARDAKLREHIAFAKGIAALPPVERARKLARYIDAFTSPPGGRELAEAATGKLQEMRNREILLGEIAPFCGGGVCRHRSLLFKILGDEAGLQVGLRRGQALARGRIIGRHAWNELTLPDGTLLIVDVMSPEPDFRLPEAGEVYFRYGDIKGEPLYKKPSEEKEPVKEAPEQKKAA